MTKPLDIPREVLDRTRELTRAATDEEAILRALEAFNARGEAVATTDADAWDRALEADVAAGRLDSLGRAALESFAKGETRGVPRGGDR